LGVLRWVTSPTTLVLIHQQMPSANETENASDHCPDSQHRRLDYRACCRCWWAGTEHHRSTRRSRASGARRPQPSAIAHGPCAELSQCAAGRSVSGTAGSPEVFGRGAPDTSGCGTMPRRVTAPQVCRARATEIASAPGQDRWPGRPAPIHGPALASHLHRVVSAGASIADEREHDVRQRIQGSGIWG
jgi:hypothetical protein